MAIRKIVKYGNPSLKHKTKKVEKFDSKVRDVVKDLFHTMYNAPGIGLAANQIGVPLQIVVIDIRLEGKNTPVTFINPRIESKSGRVCEEEGCLSVPGVLADVKRSAKVSVWALDEKGREFTINAGGLLARAIQHEFDHLNGIVFLDKLTPFKKLKARLLIRKLKKQGLW